MALVSLNARNITDVRIVSPLFIVTGLVSVMSGTYSALTLPTGGMSIVTGNLTLIQASGALDLDDRYNTAFNRGNKIEARYTNPDTLVSTLFPVIGTTYIRSTRYDMQSTLAIDITCILGLLQRVTPRDLGVCINLGVGVDISTAVRSLIEAAGVPNAQIDTASFDNLLALPQIVQPKTVDQGQSVLDLAAELAGQHGTFFCQTNTGQIKCFRWNDLSNKAKLFSKRARDLHSYKRYGSMEKRIKTYIATHSEAIVCTELTNQTQDSLVGNLRTDVRITRNDATRTITTVTREYRVLNFDPYSETLVRRVTEQAVYEPEPAESQAVVRLGQAQANGECFPQDRARLLSKTITEEISNAEYLKAYLDYLDQAADAEGNGAPNTILPSAGLADFEFVAGVNVNQTTSETWSYNSDTEIIRTVEVFAPRGYVVPILGDLKGKTDFSTEPRATPTPVINGDFDPNVFVPLVTDTEIYTRSDNACKGWKRTRQRFEAAWSNSANDIATAFENKTITFEDSFGEAQVLVVTNDEKEYNVSEPSPDSYPPATNVVDQEVEKIYGGSLNDAAYPFDTVKRQFLGQFFNFSPTEITKIGQFSMDHNNGRMMGYTMADSVFAMTQDCWEDYVPFFLCKIEEPYRAVASIYAADTPSITLSPTEAIVSWLGVFLGVQDPITVSATDFTYSKTGTNLPLSDEEAPVFPGPAAIEAFFSDLAEETL